MKTSLRITGTAVLAMGMLGAVGCQEKKVEPPKPVEVIKPVVAPTPAPIAVAEPRAEKECAAPADPGATTEIKVGSRTAKLSGAHLTFTEKDADALVLGVVGPVNEDSGSNLLALRRYVKFFQAEKADAIVVTGDTGDTAAGITRVLNELGASKLPVFVVVGNGECRAEFTDGVAGAQKENPSIINLNQVRVVEFPELTLVSLPGYHDPAYIKCATGCQYFKSTVEEVVREAKASTAPVLLVSHGPPHGSSPQSLDAAGPAGNVGDVAINKAIAATEGKIAFGLFSNIKEAGGRAAKNPEASDLLKEGEASKSLFLNPGPADTMGWEMNDGTKSLGMAAVFTLKDGQASWKSYRIKSWSAEEKAEAKKLDPAPKEAAKPVEVK